MYRTVLASLLCLAILAPCVRGQDGWRPAAGPLKTRWAADVSPANALPEYPRPQMVRKVWATLNGLWDYAITARDEAQPPRSWQGKILVPFPIESSLSGVMQPVTPDQWLWYRRTFAAPSMPAGGRLLLHFGAVDWETRVLVNGVEVGAHRGGYDPFTCDITDALNPGGVQELVVSVRDATGGLQSRGKQTLKPGGIFYTASTGIWQTVWLEPVPASSIADMRLVPHLGSSSLRVTVTSMGDPQGCTADVVALDGARPVARASGTLESEIVLTIPRAKLWSPDRPFLYGLTVSLMRGGRALDTVTSYFGMRSIALGNDAKGITRILLNGKPVFQVGPLDQGFWPDGIYTAPTDAALRFDVETMKKLGFNMARKHVKVEPDRWYYWCDKLGLLVWQDMPSGDKPTAPGETVRDSEAGRQFERELKALIDTHRNHPSIVQWVVFNEGWGQYDTERLTKWVKGYDPTRLVDNASGWTDMKCGDVIDMHNYPGPGSPKPESDRAAVLGEFGGLGLGVDGHTWSAQHWGYQGMASTAALTRRYVDLLRKVYTLKDDPGLCAAVYTQLTDVETECNGLMTYDREVMKVDAVQAAAANRGKFPPARKMVELVPTAQRAPFLWRYTFDRPADEWMKPGFDASGWKEGPAGFGTQVTPGSVVRTVWNTAGIWIRREFTLGAGPLDGAMLMLHHDEDAEVFVNGVLAAKEAGFVTNYEMVDVSAEARAALKPGRNTIAVHCRQTTGGQYIDVGIVR